MKVTKENWREMLINFVGTETIITSIDFAKLVEFKKEVMNLDPRWLKALKPGTYEFLSSVEE